MYRIMSGISNYTLNQKINAILGKTSGLPSVIDLDTTLTTGNNAGTNDIDMNNNDILQVNNIALTTINGGAYPPVVADNTLTEVLTAGNDAGGLDITNLNQLSLSGTSTITDSTGDLVIQPPTNQTIQLGNNIYVDTQNNRVGINVPVPTEDLEIDGNIQLDTGSFSKIVFYDKPNNHEHGEIDAGGEGTNGGRIRFQTKVDGGAVTEKLRITANGRIGLGGANYGTSGQVLTSNGASPPTWATIENATNATNATNCSTATTSTNDTHYVSFKTATSGNLPDRTDGELTYNPFTNVLESKILERGVTAFFSQNIPSGGGVADITFSSITNYGGSTYISGASNIAINPVQTGYYSISVIGTASQTLQGNLFGVIVEGGLSLWNDIYQDLGSNQYISGVLYINLNIVKYFTAGDVFYIRCNNWGGAISTINGSITIRLLNQIP